jgi:cysteine synthase
MFLVTAQTEVSMPKRQLCVADSVLDLIGNTPLLRLRKVAAGLRAHVYIKLEYLNPSGSTKDRMALRMIRGAEKAGKVQAGTTVIESSSGNTGIALSMVTAVKGYAMKIYCPQGVWEEGKKKIVQRFGAQIEEVPLVETQAARDAGVHGARVEIPGRVKCRDEEAAHHDVFWARQFSNPDNTTGQSEIAREILKQLDGKVDVFVASIGTGGTLLGVAKVLRKANPKVRIVAVQPAGQAGWVDPLSPEALFVPGITGGMLEEIRDSGAADDVVLVSSEEAVAMAYRLSREEGVLCGISSGANVWVALREAERLGRGRKVVTIAHDSGDRYLTQERYTT